ncbi:MAG: CDP-diacylglycerol--serine O-phosphatidyltransferase [Gemmatimonadales bacterium]|nr:MAG: CDP-diacylglycerol--serine O-phosphatidyltransferase [Gemmatimonadales bacterium]
MAGLGGGLGRHGSRTHPSPRGGGIHHAALPGPPAAAGEGLTVPGRAGLQRGIIILPSAFTLGNLFFGVYAMVAASRGDFIWAGWCIVIAAVLDMFDGRVARFTRTGSRFGAELDSLVDAISFGVAPAVVIYHIFLADQPWSWILSFIYVTAVVVRLARFNVEQGGEAKRAFHGLPSPTAGMILATLYPFFTAPGVVEWTGGPPGTQFVGVVMVGLSVLMMSHVPYQIVPTIRLRGTRAIVVTTGLGVLAVLALAVPRYFIFPFLVLYTLQGAARSFVWGLLERLPDSDPLLDEEAPADDGQAEVRSVDYDALGPEAFRSRTRPEMSSELPDDPDTPSNPDPTETRR